MYIGWTRCDHATPFGPTGLPLGASLFQRVNTNPGQHDHATPFGPTGLPLGASLFQRVNTNPGQHEHEPGCAANQDTIRSQSELTIRATSGYKRRRVCGDWHFDSSIRPGNNNKEEKAEEDLATAADTGKAAGRTQGIQAYFVQREYTNKTLDIDQHFLPIIHSLNIQAI